MRVETINTSRTIVIVAQAFNPSILRETWLIEQGILEKDELLDDSIFSSNGVQVVTEHYVLTATENHLQLRLEESADQAIIDKVLKKIVEQFKHIDYLAVGLNFDWEMRSQDKKENQNLSRLLFFNDITPVFSALDQSDAYFGGYLSKDFHSSRMKLDIKPRKGIDDEFIQFTFNYHHEPVESNKVLDIINSWSSYSKDSENNIKLVESKL